MKLKEYRIFTIESEGILHPKFFISENSGKRYSIRRIGIFNYRFEFYRKGKKKMELEIRHHFLNRKIYISQFGKLIAAFSPNDFSSISQLILTTVDIMWLKIVYYQTHLQYLIPQRK